MARTIAAGAATGLIGGSLGQAVQKAQVGKGLHGYLQRALSNRQGYSIAARSGMRQLLKRVEEGLALRAFLVGATVGQAQNSGGN